MYNWNRRDFLKGVGLTVGASALPLGSAYGADWPSRPITAVVATKQGGGVDGVARSLAPLMEPRLDNATINVVNKTGATGSIATDFVWNKPPNGYFWFLAGGFNRGLRVLGLIDTVSYLDWQFYGADTSIMSFSVPVDSDIKDMADLLKRAKDAPGKLRMSVNGPGGTWYLGATLVMQQSGTDFKLVPYKGGKPATTAALKKEVDVAGSGLHEQLDSIKAGHLRNLCIAVDKPLAIQGQNLNPITDAIPKLKGKTPIGGGASMAMRRDTDPAILKEVADAWLASVNSDEFHKIDMRKPRFPDPKVGADADRRAALWECIAANLLADTGLAKKDLKDLNIPPIDEFDSWWPPKGYKPVF